MCFAEGIQSLRQSMQLSTQGDAANVDHRDGIFPVVLCGRPILCRQMMKKFISSSKSRLPGSSFRAYPKSENVSTGVRDVCCDVIRKRRAAGAADGRKDQL